MTLAPPVQSCTCSLNLMMPLATDSVFILPMSLSPKMIIANSAGLSRWIHPSKDPAVCSVRPLLLMHDTIVFSKPKLLSNDSSFVQNLSKRGTKECPMIITFCIVLYFQSQWQYTIQNWQITTVCWLTNPRWIDETSTINTSTLQLVHYNSYTETQINSINQNKSSPFWILKS